MSTSIPRNTLLQEVARFGQTVSLGDGVPSNPYGIDASQYDARISLEQANDGFLRRTESFRDAQDLKALAATARQEAGRLDASSSRRSAAAVATGLACAGGMLGTGAIMLEGFSSLMNATSSTWNMLGGSAGLSLPNLIGLAPVVAIGGLLATVALATGSEGRGMEARDLRQYADRVERWEARIAADPQAGQPLPALPGASLSRGTLEKGVETLTGALAKDYEIPTPYLEKGWTVPHRHQEFAEHLKSAPGSTLAEVRQGARVRAEEARAGEVTASRWMGRVGGLGLTAGMVAGTTLMAGGPGAVAAVAGAAAFAGLIGVNLLMDRVDTCESKASQEMRFSHQVERWGNFLTAAGATPAAA